MRHQPIADGAKGGRTRKISDELIEQYFDQYAVNGYVSMEDMMTALGVSETTVRKYKSAKFEFEKGKGKGLRRVDG